MMQSAPTVVLLSAPQSSVSGTKLATYELVSVYSAKRQVKPEGSK